MDKQFCFIENCSKKYLISNTGKVFSVISCDYLQVDVKRNYRYYVKIKFDNETKSKAVSIKSLLEEYFPESVNNKSYWMDTEQKQKDNELLKVLKKKGYISK